MDVCVISGATAEDTSNGKKKDQDGEGKQITQAKDPTDEPDSMDVDGKQITQAKDQTDEPDSMEHVRVIAQGAALSGTAYGFLRLFLSSDRTEDTVDIIHSFATSSVALYGMASMQPHKIHTRALPPHLASGRGLVVRMFSYSLGYFVADVVKIAVDVLVRGRFPKLWQGRLAHHWVQLGANAPGILGKGQPNERNLAWRSVLCMAYAAELSSIVLRLSNLVRDGGASVRIQRMVNWALAASFFGSRILNFPVAIAMFIKARPVLPAHLFRLGATVQVGGYLLSTIWFTKILRIATKVHAAQAGLVPSIEC